MRIRITGDGTPTGTRLTDEAGNDISDHVAGVEFSHYAGDAPIATLKLGVVPVGVHAQVAGLSIGGRAVKRIEYADGTVDEFGSAE